MSAELIKALRFHGRFATETEEEARRRRYNERNQAADLIEQLLAERATPSSADSVAGGGADCGACPGDGSICKSLCKLAAESPPTTTAPVSVAEGVPAEGEVQSEEAKLYRDLTGDATAMGYEGLVDALQALRKLKDQVSDADGELPPLPKPAAKFYELDDFGNTVGRDTDDYTEKQMLDYARAAIAADRARQPAVERGAATNGEIHVLRRLIECAEKLNERPRPMCRDCADENGTCPNSGLECDMGKLFADAKALHDKLAKPLLATMTMNDSERIDTPEFRKLLADMQNPHYEPHCTRKAFIAHIVAKLAAARRAAGSGAVRDGVKAQVTNITPGLEQVQIKFIDQEIPEWADVGCTVSLFAAPSPDAPAGGKDGA